MKMETVCMYIGNLFFKHFDSWLVESEGAKPTNSLHIKCSLLQAAENKRIRQPGPMPAPYTRRVKHLPHTLERLVYLQN